MKKSHLATLFRTSFLRHFAFLTPLLNLRRFECKKRYIEIEKNRFVGLTVEGEVWLQKWGIFFEKRENIIVKRFAILNLLHNQSSIR